MPSPPTRESQPDLAVGAGLLLVLTLAAVPFLGMLDAPPEAVDGIRLITRGQTEADWFAWTFLTNHWIGYRPVSALSFTLTHALGGQLWQHRLVSILAHLFALTGLFATFRALTRDRGPYALLAVGLAALHPTTSAVVPRLAERSYSLAVGFGLWSVAALVHASRRERWLLPTLAASALFGMALLSNETAGVFALLGPLALWRASRPLPGAQVARQTGIYLGLTLPAAIGIRLYVLGDLGGYRVARFVDLGGVRPVWTSGAEVSRWTVAWESLENVLLPTDPVSAHRMVPLGLLGAAAVAAYYAWRLARKPPSPAAWSLLWILLGSAVAAGALTWFPRMAYASGFASALLVAVVLRDGLRESTGAQRGLHVGAFAWVALALLLNGPARNRHYLKPNRTARLVQNLERLRSDINTPALVYLVLPDHEHNAAAQPHWLHHIGDAEQIEYRLAASTAAATGPLTQGRLPLTQGARPSRGVPAALSNGQLLLARLPVEAQRHTYLYWTDASGPHLSPVPGPDQPP